MPISKLILREPRKGETVGKGSSGVGSEGSTGKHEGCKIYD